MEIADIVVINKTDLGRADRLAVDIDSVLKQQKRRDNWMPNIIETQAMYDLDAKPVYEAIELHHLCL
jgi:putative protein kinase ArgK-like GTPase of G3E family